MSTAIYQWDHPGIVGKIPPKCLTLSIAFFTTPWYGKVTELGGVIMAHYPITFREFAQYIGCTVKVVEQLAGRGMPVLGKPHEKAEPLVDVEAVREWLAANYPQRRQALDKVLPPLPLMKEKELPVVAEDSITIEGLIHSEAIERYQVDPDNIMDVSGAVALYQRLTRARVEKLRYDRERGTLVDRGLVKTLLQEVMVSLSNHFGEPFCRRLEDQGADYTEVRAYVNDALNSMKDDIVRNAERTFPTVKK